MGHAELPLSHKQIDQITQQSRSTSSALFSASATALPLLSAVIFFRDGEVSRSVHGIAHLLKDTQA